MSPKILQHSVLMSAKIDFKSLPAFAKSMFCFLVSLQERPSFFLWAGRLVAWILWSQGHRQVIVGKGIAGILAGPTGLLVSSSRWLGAFVLSFCCVKVAPKNIPTWGGKLPSDFAGYSFSSVASRRALFVVKHQETMPSMAFHRFQSANHHINIFQKSKPLPGVQFDGSHIKAALVPKLSIFQSNDLQHALVV